MSFTAGYRTLRTYASRVSIESRCKETRSGSSSLSWLYASRKNVPVV